MNSITQFTNVNVHWCFGSPTTSCKWSHFQYVSVSLFSKSIHLMNPPTICFAFWPHHVLSHCLFWVKQNRKKSWFRTFRSSWLSMGLLAPPLEPNRWFSKSAQIYVCFRTTIPRTLKVFWASHQSFLAPTWILPRDLGVSMLDNAWCTPQSMGKWYPTYFLKTNRFGGWN